MCVCVCEKRYCESVIVEVGVEVVVVRVVEHAVCLYDDG